MHRPTVGLIALTLLAGAAACWTFGYASVAMISAFWRVGFVMGLLWLALPDLLSVRHKFWLFVFVALLLMAVILPKLLPLVLLFCVIYAVLRPRSPKPRVDRKSGDGRQASGVRREVRRDNRG